jgi:excisionase family DNA binding protein
MAPKLVSGLYEKLITETLEKESRKIVVSYRVSLVCMSLLVMTLAGCAHYQPSTREGNQCKNECIQNYNTCVPVSGTIGCGFSRDECYERCKRFEEPEQPRKRYVAREDSNPSSGASAPSSTRSGADTSTKPSETSDESGSDGLAAMESCLTGKLCKSTSSCLSGQVCDVEARQCARLSCLSPMVEKQATSTVKTVESTATVLALAKKGSLTQPQEAPAETGDARPVESFDRDVSDRRSEPSTKNTTFTASEAASLCGVETSVIRGWVADGKLRAVKIGGSYRISRAELATTWREMGGGELFDD